MNALLAAGQLDPGRHVVQHPERVVPPAALVEGGVDEQPGRRVERVDPAAGQLLALLGQGDVADVPGDLGGAVVAEREVEGVGDRVRDAAQQELLAVGPPQVGVHVHQRPVPVDAGRRPSWHRSARNVCASALPWREKRSVPLRHPVADREVALLLADGEQGVGQLDRAVGEQRGDQRQLRPVDVPHGAEVEDERAVGRPERALVRGEAGLDQRVVERGGEDRLPVGSTASRRGSGRGPRATGRRSRRAGSRSWWSSAGRAARRPQSASRFARACSTPRSEKPKRSSSTWPGSVGPRHISPNGRSVVGRIRSKSSRVPPGISRRSYQSSWRQPATSASRWTASGAPSTTISACATPGPSASRCARSGTVAP